MWNRLYIVYTNKPNSVEIIETIPLLSPIVLLKEVDNIIKNHNEKYFFSEAYYTHKEHKNIFWNIIYYFKLLQLPLFVLTAVRNDSRLNHILDELTFIREMSITKSNKITLKHYGTYNEAKFSSLLELQKNYSSNPINNEFLSKNGNLVNDHVSLSSSPINKINSSSKDWENIYNKM